MFTRPGEIYANDGVIWIVNAGHGLIKMGHIYNSVQIIIYVVVVDIYTYEGRVGILFTQPKAGWRGSYLNGKWAWS